jgi:hypothetical protein
MIEYDGVRRPAGVGSGGVKALLSSYQRQRAPVAAFGFEGHAMRGRFLLEASSFCEWAGIHDVKLELELVE